MTYPDYLAAGDDGMWLRWVKYALNLPLFGLGMTLLCAP